MRVLYRAAGSFYQKEPDEGPSCVHPFSGFPEVGGGLHSGLAVGIYCESHLAWLWLPSRGHSEGERVECPLETTQMK